MRPKRRSAARSDRYPRAARINRVLREVIGEELERAIDVDDRLGVLTVTGVDCSEDFKTAKVYLDSLPPASAEALLEHRARIQSAIAKQVRLKYTPHLSFESDPAVQAALRVEEALQRTRRREPRQ